MNISTDDVRPSALVAIEQANPEFIRFNVLLSEPSFRPLAQVATISFCDDLEISTGQSGVPTDFVVRCSPFPALATDVCGGVPCGTVQFSISAGALADASGNTNANTVNLTQVTFQKTVDGAPIVLDAPQDATATSLTDAPLSFLFSELVTGIEPSFMPSGSFELIR